MWVIIEFYCRFSLVQKMASISSKFCPLLIWLNNGWVIWWCYLNYISRIAKAKIKSLYQLWKINRIMTSLLRKTTVSTQDSLSRAVLAKKWPRAAAINKVMLAYAKVDMCVWPTCQCHHPSSIIHQLIRNIYLPTACCFFSWPILLSSLWEKNGFCVLFYSHFS